MGMEIRDKNYIAWLQENEMSAEFLTLGINCCRIALEALDKGKSVSAIFMDLFKAFDTLDHDLLIASLTNLFLRNILCIYRNSYMIIIWP